MTTSKGSLGPNRAPTGSHIDLYRVRLIRYSSLYSQIWCSSEPRLVFSLVALSSLHFPTAPAYSRIIDWVRTQCGSNLSSNHFIPAASFANDRPFRPITFMVGRQCCDSTPVTRAASLVAYTCYTALGAATAMEMASWKHSSELYIYTTGFRYQDLGTEYSATSLHSARIPPKKYILSSYGTMSRADPPLPEVPYVPQPRGSLCAFGYACGMLRLAEPRDVSRTCIVDSAQPLSAVTHLLGRLLNHFD